MEGQVRTGSRWPGHGTTLALAGQLTLLAALAASVGLGWRGWLAGTAFGVVLWALLTAALRRCGARRLGAANAVTLGRATLLGGVVALVCDSAGRPAVPVALLVALAGVALLLDGVDGQVARRTGTVTRLGARFDVETDAVLLMVLSLFVARSLGWWVLLIGGLRYLFVAAAWLLPWLRGELAPRWSRKAVAAVQGITLVVLSSGALPGQSAGIVAGTALALLVWSFGRDIAGLWRRRVVAVPARAMLHASARGPVLGAAHRPVGAADLPPVGAGAGRVAVRLTDRRREPVRIPV